MGYFRCNCTRHRWGGLRFIFAVVLFGLLSAILSCANYANDANMNKGRMSGTAPTSESYDMDKSAEYAAAQAPPGMGEAGSNPELTASDRSNTLKITEASLDWMASEAAAAEMEAMMVYTAELSITVDDGPASAEKAIELAKKRGGYLTQTNQTGKEDELVITLQLKIPSAKLFEYVKEIKGLGEVEYENVDGQDVSEEYFDLEARKASLELSLARLTDLLAKSGKLTDLLTIEQEVTRTQEMLNQVTGRMKKLEHMSAYSTVNITLSLEPMPDIYEPPKFSWMTNTAWGNSWGSFLVFLRLLWNLAIFAAAWSPLIAVIVIIVVATKARRRSRKAKSPGTL